MTASPTPDVPTGAASQFPAEPDNGAGARSYGLPGRAAAEAVGTALLVFAGLGLTIFSTQGGISAPLAFGLGLAAAMVAFGYVSGGHFNPAVTLAVATAGRLPWISVPVYVAAQLVGAIFGTFVLWAALSGYPGIGSPGQIFAQSVNGFGEDTALGFPLAGSLLLEVIAAALLTAVFLGATVRAGARAGSAPFAVGVAYAVLLSVLAPVTGGGLNPARSTAPVLFGDFTGAGQLWLFWVAPLVGALITGLIYRSIDLTRSEALQRADGTHSVSDGTHSVSGGADSVPGAGAGQTGGASAATTATGATAATGTAGESDAVDTSAAGSAAAGGPERDEARSFFDSPEDGNDDGHGDDDGLRGNGRR